MEEMRADVVIIGGAVTGAATAWWLMQMAPDLKVTVIEKDPTYARSATALSVASVRQQFSNPVNVEISRFGVDFIRNFAERIGPEGGIASLGLKENGYLFLSGTEDGARTLAELAAMQRSLGAATEVLDAAALATRFPWMNLEDVTAGSIGARDEGWFDNMGLLNGFRAAARARGAVFLADRVTGLERAGDRVTAALTEGGRRIEAGAFLCAAGTRSAAVCAMAGIDLPVEPRKRTVFVVDAPNARHADAPLIIDHTGVYLRPEHGAWIAATVPDDDGPCDPDDFEPDHAQFEELIWPRLYHRSEGFDAVKVLRLWVGHYDYNTLDQNAVLGRWPGHANFHVAAGFSGHGLQQSPAVGRAMAELILHGGYRSLDLLPLGPERVLEGRPFLEKAIV
ncbi:MAG: FAD-binding oxidoreductase [Rhodobacteraceae bacterium]|jgi:glycine/D-amino acid oxidase-like deaminating enzyme|uniref:NAD(P)/FAD-dependent oxidoreductase n=1 Tax=Albidovulum sp. TaxID=1872424 RepID=UPI001DDB8149|nr:FAD-binding oxidoreductase [uncultured Defluviimonas sp.]MCB2127235.1 FAD-binding oxidoreductase [Paracoccaceae bacterium]